MNWKKKKDTPEAQTPEAAAAGKGPVPFLKKNWKWLVPVLCVAVAGGVFLLRPQQAKPASVDASYTEAAPERRDVTNTLSGTGTLNPANTYTVKSLVDGKVLTGTIEEGDIVEESNVLYTIDSSDASTNLEKAEIAMQQLAKLAHCEAHSSVILSHVDENVFKKLEVNITFEPHFQTKKLFHH